MFEVLGFIAAFIIGIALTFSGFGGAFTIYAFSGKYDRGSVALTIMGIIGVTIVVLTLKHSPFTIILS